MNVDMEGIRLIPYSTFVLRIDIQENKDIRQNKELLLQFFLANFFEKRNA